MTTARELGDFGGVVTVEGGNVGLGVTPSTGIAGWTHLNINGAGSTLRSNATIVDLLQNSTGDGKYVASSQSTLYRQTAGQHQWFYAPSGTAGNTITFTQGMVLDASGNLAVGTTSANRRVEIAGASSGETYQLRIGAGASNSAYTYDIGRSTVDGLFYFYGNQSGANGYVFSGANGERARIDSSGNLLVGTTSNVGNSRIAVSGSGTGGAYLMRLGSAATGGATADGLEFVYGDGVTKGSVRWNSTTTAYNTSSDYRLKENIAPMTGALAKVQALKPCTYKWKVDGSSGEGFIAHELAEVVPQCVTGEKDAVDAEGNPIYQGIDTSFLVATLTAAIQEQQALIESLTARITALEGSSSSPATV